jgi:hypothetical protein
LVHQVHRSRKGGGSPEVFVFPESGFYPAHAVKHRPHRQMTTPCPQLLLLRLLIHAKASKRCSNSRLQPARGNIFSSSIGSGEDVPPKSRGTRLMTACRARYVPRDQHSDVEITTILLLYIISTPSIDLVLLAFLGQIEHLIHIVLVSVCQTHLHPTLRPQQPLRRRHWRWGSQLYC